MPEFGHLCAHTLHRYEHKLYLCTYKMWNMGIAVFDQSSILSNILSLVVPQYSNASEEGIRFPQKIDVGSSVSC